MFDMIWTFLSQYPVFIQVLTYIGLARLIFKPIMVMLDSIVAVTPTSKDDEFLSKLKDNKIYKGIVFAFDYIASIKIPGSK